MRFLDPNNNQLSESYTTNPLTSTFLQKGFPQGEIFISFSSVQEEKSLSAHTQGFALSQFYSRFVSLYAVCDNGGPYWAPSTHLD